MALVGNISGSISSNSNIAISGTVVVANRPDSLFPTLSSIGSDVVFFVSGTRGGKGSASDRTVSVFGGDAVVSGALTIGTGSVTITSNDITFQGGVTKIYSGSGGLTLEDSSGTRTLAQIIAGGGGGGGDSFFSSTTAGSIFTTGSAAFRGGETSIDSPSDVGANLFFYVSGSKTSGGRPTSGVSSFGGDLVVTGTLYLGDGSVAGIYNRDGGALLYSTSPTSVVLGQDVILNTNIIKANDGNTAITLSSTNVTVAGNLTGSNALVNGALTTTGDATIGGNIVADSEEAKSIFVNVGANNVTIGSANGNVVIGNDLQVDGNDIKMSGGTTAITFSGAGNVAVAGDLTVTGNDIKSSTGATAITLSNDNVIIAGDLTINGTTTTIDSTTVSIQDPVIGVGFTSGSASRGSPGDRGFIGGLDGENNVAMVWDESNDGFAVFRTTSSTTSSLPLDIVDYSTFRAGKVELGGTGAFVTSSDGLNLTARSSAQMTLTGSTLVTIGTNGGTGQNVLFNFGHNQTRASLAWQPANTLASFGGADGIGLQLSSSAGNLRFRHSTANVAGFYIDTATNPYASLAFASNITRFESASPRVEFGNSNNGITVLSGSTTIVNHGVGKLTVQKDGTQYLGIDYSVGASTAAISGSASQNLVVASGLGSTVLTLSGSSVTTNAGVVNFQRNGTTIAFVGASPDANPLTGLFPNSDVTYNLGSPARRWANIYTGDLHLRNERGDYTLIEEEDFLTIRFNKTGKRYKFLLEPVPEFDES